MKKQFCIRNHDTALCGRNKYGTCNICYSERRVSGCKRGHDLQSVGRFRNGRCKACASFCKEGHDKTVDGVVRKRCLACLRAGFIRDHEKIQSARRKHRANNPMYHREKWWEGQGMTNPDGTQFTRIDYDRLYQIQSGRCPGCLRHQSELNGAFHADHDHATGFVRGLLCGSCNKALGLVHDDPKTMLRLANFLESRETVEAS